MRYKRPDSKNALSIVEAAKREMKYTLSIKLTEESGSTIIRNIYECFRMLGDSLLVKKGIISQDHLEPVRELLKLQVSTPRPINLIDNLRILRHNINYYGYNPKIEEVKDALSFTESSFEIIYNQVLKNINE
ncbi:Uncharacterised protein [uncultured archaeon]|nr:Uncharacterised protein [uncultured archaeon]